MQSRAKILCSVTASIVASLGVQQARAALSFSVVNVIPNSQSSETDTNAEANIAINPNNAQQVLVSAFNNQVGTAGQPYFLSANGSDWKNWSVADTEVHTDTTIDWSPTGNIYMSRLFSNAGNDDVAIHRSSPPNPPVALAEQKRLSALFAATDPDQPWTKVTQNGADDRVYASLNDLGRPAAGNRASASVMFSLNANAGAGGTYKIAQIERGNPFVQDVAGVRIAPRPGSNTVYAAFERPTANGALNANNFTGQVIVVRDDNAGNGAGVGTEFTGLGTLGSNALGFNVTKELPFSLGAARAGGTTLGKERLGSDLSIAVDPTNANRLYLAYCTAEQDPADGNKVKPRINIVVSDSNGSGWSNERKLEFNTALPALAVAGNGMLGIEYTELSGNQMKTHFSSVSYDDFTTFVTNFDTLRTNNVLSTFDQTTVNSAVGPYIGDYQDLEAVGDTFYGAFAASNDPQAANFPEGCYYQRNWSTGTMDFNGGPIMGNGNSLIDAASISIDPYFFKVQVPEPTALAIVALVSTIPTLRRQRR